jgi:hypothetical protein
LAFEKNQGQTDAQVKYMARGSGYTLFLTSRDAVFSLTSRSAAGGAAERDASRLRLKSSARRNAEKIQTAVVRMQLVGGNSQAKVSAGGELPGKSNYFIGNDRNKWRTGVMQYARVSYRDVYPGVNLAFHGAQRQVEFDFVVAPGANPAPISFRFSGDGGLKTDEADNLVVSSAAGDVLLHKPVAYQEKNGVRQLVDARFSLMADNRVAFELGDYDRSRELVIDPSVSYAYSTYLGGSLEDDGNAIAFDVDSNGAANHAYVTGSTLSLNFPVQGTNAGPTGGGDVFVTELSADGTTLIYSTLIGGSASDIANGIAVDSTGEAFVAGGTASSDFPTTSGAYQTVLPTAAQNAFILKLNKTTGTLAYSTYLGGSGDDTALGMELDGSGNVYVAGKTTSADFPSKNALQTTVAGGFVATLTPAGGRSSDLLFSTYIGGSTNDFASAIAVDLSGNAYVTGETQGSFNTTSGVVQPTFGGGITDAFVTAIKPKGSAYIYSTYLGGSDIDIGNGIAVDASGNAYVTGQTASSSTSTTPFPTTTGAFQTTSGGGPPGTYDAFVTKLNSKGTALTYSTYLGGAQADYGIGVAVDGSGDAYVTGRTYSTTTFPTLNPTQATFAGTSDAFVSEVNATGKQVIFSTYLGSTGDQDTNTNGGIAVDNAGSTMYVTGNTTSSSFPDTTGFFQPGYGGGTADAFVVKYAQPAFTMTATTPAAVAAGASATSTVTLTSYNGDNSPVNLTCTVTGTGSPLPACSASSFLPASPVVPLVTPGAPTTLTITTTGPSGALFHPRNIFYAMWLPIAGLSLVGIGFSTSRSRRKKMVGFVMLGMTMTALILLPACGGSSSSTGTGGGSCATVPSVPAGLAATSTTFTGTTLNWSAATAGANCTVTGYAVYENGSSTPLGTPTTTTLAVTGLTAATTYSFTVAATDAAGTSAPSTPAVSVTTLAPTPAGSYTITVTGTDANNRTQSVQFPLTVN